MTLNLEDLEAVARAATPGPWTYKPTILGSPNTTVMAGDDQLGYIGVGHFLAPNATHVATFDPPTVLTLIAKLREAERHNVQLLDEAVKREARVRRAEAVIADAITWMDAGNRLGGHPLRRILTAYKPTNQEGES